MVGFDPDGDIIDEEYGITVLSRNKSQLYSSLSWLTEHEVINKTDLQTFERIKATRNSLAHKLPSLVMGDADFKHIERFQKILNLLRKIEVWWAINVEIAINPNFDGQEIDETEIFPGPVLTLQMMLEVLSGNEDLLKKYRKSSGTSKSGF